MIKQARITTFVFTLVLTHHHGNCNTVDTLSSILKVTQNELLDNGKGNIAEFSLKNELMGSSQKTANISCHSPANQTIEDSSISDSIEMCHFASMLHCITSHFLTGRVFFYFDDRFKYNFTRDYIGNMSQVERQRFHAFHFETKDRILDTLRGFVITVLQSNVDVVAVFLNEDIFRMLMDVWIREGYEQVMSWLYIDGNRKIHYYAPKCEHFQEPMEKPLQTIDAITTENTCNSEAFKTLQRGVKRCNRRHNHPLIRVAVKVEAPWVVETQGNYVNGEIYCERAVVCNMPKHTANGEIVWERKCCTGSMIEIFLEVIKFAHIQKYMVYGVPDGRYGGIVSCPNNNFTDATKCQWDGLFNELLQGRADIAATSLTWTSARQAVADIPEYIDLSPLSIVMNREIRNKPIITWSYVKMVDSSLALTLLLTYFVLYIAVLIIEHASNIGNRRSFYTLHEILTYLGGLTFQRDLGGRNPFFWPSRVPSLMYAFATTIIMTTYTADLTAKGVVVEESNFKGMKDSRIVNPSNDFIFSVPVATYTSYYFEVNVDERYRKSYEFMKPYQSNIDLDGVEKVYKQEIDAYISDSESLTAVVNLAKYCSALVMEPLDITALPYSFALQKNSKFTPFFSKHIFNMKFEGTIKAIRKKWYYRSDRCAGADAKAEQFDWKYAISLEVLLFGATCVCIFILIFENVFARLHWKRQT
ncbi:glutamate receptor ionotropic, NMDA 1-like [Clytia hemisphaerica]